MDFKSQNNDHISLYEQKSRSYFSSSRNSIAALVSQGKHRVLDIGCGNGALLLSLKEQGKASEIVGIEINNLQALDGIDNYIIGDIESLQLPYPKEYFDVIICADVLEHLKDPWDTLKRLTFFLKPNGKFIISLPNIREIRTLGQIAFRGDFAYSERGILDKTHLRFFCKRNMLEIVNAAGLRVSDIYPAMGLKRTTLNQVTFKLLEECLAIQYVIVASRI